MVACFRMSIPNDISWHRSVISIVLVVAKKKCDNPHSFKYVQNIYAHLHFHETIDTKPRMDGINGQNEM